MTGADSGKRAAADFPGVDLEVVKAVLGPENCSKASNGSKQFTVCLGLDVNCVESILPQAAHHCTNINCPILVCGVCCAVL